MQENSEFEKMFKSLLQQRFESRDNERFIEGNEKKPEFEKEDWREFEQEVRKNWEQEIKSRIREGIQNIIIKKNPKEQNNNNNNNIPHQNQLIKFEFETSRILQISDSQRERWLTNMETKEFNTGNTKFFF